MKYVAYYPFSTVLSISTLYSSVTLVFFFFNVLMSDDVSHALSHTAHMLHTTDHHVPLSLAKSVNIS